MSEGKDNEEIIYPLQAQNIKTETNTTTKTEN
jgi:hypothetical protein